MAPVILFTGATTLEILAVVGLPSILTFLFQMLYNKLSGKRAKEKNEASCAKEEVKIIKIGMKSLLRDKLRKNYLFYKSRGYAEIFDKENYHEMYTSYHNLGGNGMIDKMYAEVMNMAVSEHEHEHK